jgi:hypothetical protein
MHAKSILPVVMIGLLFAMDANAATNSRTAGVTRLPDGRTVASAGGMTKTCKASEMPLATGGRTTVTTAKSTKTYPHGVVLCLDPADFGGGAVVTTDNGEVVVKPAPPSGTPST